MYRLWNSEHVPTLRTAQKTTSDHAETSADHPEDPEYMVEIPQVQFNVGVVDVPVVMQ